MWTARRPELLVGDVDTVPRSIMTATMFETVAADRPVCRAISARVDAPFAINVSTTRRTFYSLW